MKKGQKKKKEKGTLFLSFLKKVFLGCFCHSPQRAHSNEPIDDERGSTNEKKMKQKSKISKL
jgi:hypothetical protein